MALRVSNAATGCNSLFYSDVVDIMALRVSSAASRPCSMEADTEAHLSGKLLKAVHLGAKVWADDDASSSE